MGDHTIYFKSGVYEKLKKIAKDMKVSASSAVEQLIIKEQNEIKSKQSN